MIVSAGFFGCELAASFRSLGLHMTPIESGPAPLASVLEDAVGGWIAELHRARGVEAIVYNQVSAFTGHGRADGVTLADGQRVPADFVVTGIGSAPAELVDQLRNYRAGDGILCDEYGRSSAEDVRAVGDVAAWKVVSTVNSSTGATSVIR